MQQKLITILGPTAVGKTKFAVQLAHRFNGEIISADSRQVYRNMNLGTGKDLDDYFVNGNQVKYHLIDVIDPQEEYDLFKFKKMFGESFADIIKRDKLPFLVGGTGLYIHSVLKDYYLPVVDFNTQRAEELRNSELPDLQKILNQLNPKLHNTTDLLNKDRVIKAILIAEQSAENKVEPSIHFESLVIGVNLPRNDVKKRITDRLKKRLQAGMIDEVKSLIDMGISFDKLLFFGLEYKFIGLYLKNELNYNDMFQKLNSAIHNFAKRQMTWFRKMEREGIEIHWLKPTDAETAELLIAKFISRN